MISQTTTVVYDVDDKIGGFDGIFAVSAIAVEGVVSFVVGCVDDSFVVDFVVDFIVVGFVDVVVFDLGFVVIGVVIVFVVVGNWRFYGRYPVAPVHMHEGSYIVIVKVVVVDLIMVVANGFDFVIVDVMIVVRSVAIVEG